MLKPGRTIRIGLATAALWACTPPPKTPQPIVEPTPDAAPVATADAAPPRLRAEKLCDHLVQRTRGESSATPEIRERRLAVVAAHCPRWPEAVQRCLAAAAEQGPCMRELDPDLRKAFVTEIGRAMIKTPTCEEIAADPERWLAIPAAATGDSRGRAALAIGDAVEASCAGWPEPVRQCTRDQAGSPRICLEADVLPTVGTELDAQLARRAQVWKRAATFKPRDRAIACRAVVAAHYGPAAWKGKLDDLGASERKRAIKLSTSAFAAACKDEPFSAFMRGCLISVKTEAERGWCIDSEQRWAYPARGVLPPAPPDPATGTASTGLPSCDDLASSVEQYLVCAAVTPADRDDARGTLRELTDAWTAAEGAALDAKQAVNDRCRLAAESIKTRLAAAGCDP